MQLEWVKNLQPKASTNLAHRFNGLCSQLVTSDDATSFDQTVETCSHHISFLFLIITFLRYRFIQFSLNSPKCSSPSVVTLMYHVCFQVYHHYLFLSCLVPSFFSSHLLVSS